MQKWARRLSGPIVSGLLLLHGLPGFIDDSTTWLSWIKDMSLPWIVYPVGIVGALLFGTSEWWWPWLSTWVKRIKANNETIQELETALTTTTPGFEDLEQFRSCLPHVQRCRELIRPYAGTGGQFKIAVQVLGARDVFAEIATELEYLAKQLSTLGIWSPNIWGEEGNDSLDRVHSRLRDWSFHLARLEARIHQDDLEGARL